MENKGHTYLPILFASVLLLASIIVVVFDPLFSEISKSPLINMVVCTGAIIIAVFILWVMAVLVILASGWKFWRYFPEAWRYLRQTPARNKKIN